MQRYRDRANNFRGATVGFNGMAGVVFGVGPGVVDGAVVVELEAGVAGDSDGRMSAEESGDSCDDSDSDSDDPDSER